MYRMPFFTSPYRTSRCLSVLIKQYFGFALLVCFFFILSSLSTVSASSEMPKSPAEILEMPSEYGEVIYRIHPQSPKQLYVIGINHKDPNSGENNDTTIQTQIEIFRIGEWLKKNKSLDLLLPEGYFSKKNDLKKPKQIASPTLDTFNPVYLDKLLIQKKLSVATYVNAEMLLMKYHRFHASQVETRDTYDAVRNSLFKLHNTSTQSGTADNMAELFYLQQVRTAQILQNIPGVIEGEFQNGTIGNHSALFTIGLNHIKDIFRYIQDDVIHIVSPTGSDVHPDFLFSGLNLLKTGYGITIILPRTLANDRKLLQMTRIDRILLADDKYTERVR